MGRMTRVHDDPCSAPAAMIVETNGESVSGLDGIGCGQE